jgi:diguanylate cyclase (GGDEF)-like protein/PAS domain S-box-containing protein
MPLKMSLKKINPVTQLSVGLVCLTVSILCISELLGFIPNTKDAELEARKRFVESLAIQFSTLANSNSERHIKKALDVIVKRDENILSAAVRSKRSNFIAGNHENNWTNDDPTLSKNNQVVVPVYKGKNRWGQVEVRFAPPETNYFAAWKYRNAGPALMLFVGLMGIFAYRLFMKRALKELDPSAAIPERVRNAFNALAEGVLIIDENHNVVLANAAFQEQAGVNGEDLVGHSASTLGWQSTVSGATMPWDDVFEDGTSRTGVRLLLKNPEGHERIFMVNCVAISDDDGTPRGALATFDDVSELEEKNTKLRKMLAALQISQKKIRAQNEELHILATRDPMTNCLNRRSFYEIFQKCFDEAREEHRELAAFMVDIDHFKSVNDNFGHAAGDEIIKIVAAILHENVREFDLVARYGGEEFAVVLLDIDEDGAKSIANRIRKAIENSSAPDHLDGRGITASLGVSMLSKGAVDKEALLDEADQALYVAKESGRNRVISWSRELESDKAGEALENSKAETATLEEQTAVEIQPVAATPIEDKSLRDIPAANDSSDSIAELQARIRELEEDAAEHSMEVAAMIRFDRLTGLQQRDYFHETISDSIARGYRYEQHLAVLSLEITNFRLINDTLGHEAADMLLGEIAVRLESELRATDKVAASKDQHPTEISRINSDEFGILINDLETEEAIQPVLQRLLTQLGRPLTLKDHIITPACAVGVSVYPNDGNYAELLTRNASVARQFALQQGGDKPIKFFREEMNASAEALLQSR